MGGEILAHLPPVCCKGQEWMGSLFSRAFSRCGLWSVSPLRNWTPVLCQWSPPWLCWLCKDSLLFPWKRRTQVHIAHIWHIMYMHIDVLHFILGISSVRISLFMGFGTISWSIVAFLPRCSKCCLSTSPGLKLMSTSCWAAKSACK